GRIDRSPRRLLGALGLDATSPVPLNKIQVLPSPTSVTNGRVGPLGQNLRPRGRLIECRELSLSLGNSALAVILGVDGRENLLAINVVKVAQQPFHGCSPLRRLKGIKQGLIVALVVLYIRDSSG